MEGLPAHPFYPALANALLYVASYAIWLERTDAIDHPGWRETWVRQPPEVRVRFVEGLVAREPAPIRRGPRDVVRTQRERA